MSETENKISSDDKSTCYKGCRKREWTKVVQDMQSVSEELLPRILRKCARHDAARQGCDHPGNEIGYTGVVDAFPMLPDFKFEDLNDCFNAMEFCNAEASNIDAPKAISAEKSALKTLLILNTFIETLNHRKKNWDLWTTLALEYEELPKKEYNIDTLILEIEHKQASANNQLKTDIAQQIMQRYKEYGQLKSNFEHSLKLFKEMSKKMAQLEHVDFNKYFNPNQQINYFVLEKEGFRDAEIHYKTYLKEQDDSWKSVLNYLNRDSEHQQSLDKQQEHEAYAQPKFCEDKSAKLLMKLVSRKAIIPTRASELSAGLDLYALETTLIQSYGKGVLPTGISIKLPPGTYGRIAPRSGLSLNSHISIGGGVIDEDYTGEVKVIIFNHGKTPIKFPAGTKIAQLICESIKIPSIELVEELQETDRGAKGFGSSGNHEISGRTDQ